MKLHCFPNCYTKNTTIFSYFYIGTGQTFFITIFSHLSYKIAKSATIGFCTEVSPVRKTTFRYSLLTCGKTRPFSSSLPVLPWNKKFFCRKPSFQIFREKFTNPPRQGPAYRFSLYANWHFTMHIWNLIKHDHFLLLTIKESLSHLDQFILTTPRL